MILNQSYAGPVGTVNNTEVHIHGEVTGFHSPTARLPLHGWLALAMLDRGPQITAVMERLESIARHRSGGTFLVILRGIRRDFHQAFVLRCGMAEFGRALGDSYSWDYLGRLRWTPGANSVEPLLKGVRDALGFTTLTHLNDIEARLVALDRSICFSHFLHVSSWTQKQEQLVLRWIHYVNTLSSKMPTGRFIVSFLCVNNSHGPRKILDMLTGRQLRLRVFLRHVDSIYGNVVHSPILVPDKLTLIRHADFDEWPAAVARFLKRPELEPALFGAGDQLLRFPIRGRRFGEVFRRLSDVLSDVLTNTMQNVEFQRRDR